MHTIGIRRTKTTRVNGRLLVELPPRELHDVPITLDKASRAVYDAWAKAGEGQTVHDLCCSDEGPLARIAVVLTVASAVVSPSIIVLVQASRVKTARHVTVHRVTFNFPGLRVIT